MRLFAARLAKGSSVAVFVLVTNMGYQNVYKNGAAPLVVKAIITPTSSKTKMIGVSHHFLLLNKKSMNSRMIPTLPEIASCSNDVFFSFSSIVFSVLARSECSLGFASRS